MKNKVFSWALYQPSRVRSSLLWMEAIVEAFEGVLRECRETKSQLLSCWQREKDRC